MSDLAFIWVYLRTGGLEHTPDPPATLSSDLQDSVNFVTIRVLKGNLSAPVTVEKGVHGFLIGWYYKECLANFLKDARGGDPHTDDEPAKWEEMK